MNWKGKNVLVTGAGGFIGSHLTERLVELGANVRGFVHYNAQGSAGWLDGSPLRQQVEVLAGDIVDRDTVQTAMRGVETVFHVGRIVHTSTSEVYGTARHEPIDEEHPLQGQSPYSASKIGADKIAESFHLSFEIPVVTVRPFNTFGPRQSARAVIPTIISQCLTQQEIQLGNLHPTRDLNYVANTVDGFVLAASHDGAVGKTINLGSGRKISIGELAKLITSMMSKKITIKHDDKRTRPENSEVGCLLADNTLAQTLLGWEPRVSLEQGLKLTIEWMQTNLDRYRPHEFAI